ncbi:unnamed protein product [Moneuplotes crassus]|uniref:Multidrug and toxin extrusion protein n=1 Tax=Euplotes crassus TaxID=5936 RepID=A0AAD1X6J3_EUPCR|nr:unnamed protein product [Moneuplotes crassus]
MSHEGSRSKEGLIEKPNSADLQEEVIPYAEAVKKMVAYAGPTAGALLAKRIPDLYSYYVIGRMGDPRFTSGVGLGIMLSGMFCVSLGIGLFGGIDTLCSHAFGMGKNYLAGRYYTRAQVVQTALFVPQAIFLYYSDYFLMLIGQPEQSSIYAGEYLRIMIPGLWAYCQTECLRRFLGTQGSFKLMMITQIISTLSHFFWIYLFVSYLELSFHGIGYATCMTQFVNLMAPILYICYDNSVVKPDCWHWINGDSFIGLYEFLKFGIPSMIMITFEVWAFEALEFIAGYVGELELGVFVIFWNYILLIFNFPASLQISSNSLIGNALGASKPKDAKVYMNVAVSAALICGITISVMSCLLRSQIIGLYTTDEALKTLAVATMPWICLSFVGDNLQGATQGVIRAMGCQDFGTLICLIGYWVISIPLTFVFTFYLDFGIVGMCLGLPIGLMFVGLSFVAKMYTINLEKLSEEVTDRIKDQSQNKHNIGGGESLELQNRSLSGYI